MSADATAWVWAHSPYKDTEPRMFIVHLAIADVVNDAHDWEFFMASRNLAAKAGCTRELACRTVRQMVRDGLLEVITPSVVDGKPTGRPAHYRFLMGVDRESTGVDRESTPGWIVRAHGVDRESTRNSIELKKELKLSPAHSVRSERRKPKLRFPESFALRDQDYEWAEEKCPRVDVSAETANFATWWRADGGVKADWYQAWRNWMTKAQARAARQPSRRFA